jgi:hypothetical protein
MSAKNGVARDCLVELGFTDDGAGNYVVAVEPAEALPPHFMRIE